MIYIDLETRSKADLKVVGGHAYAEDPSTEILCGAALDMRGPVPTFRVWTRHAVPLAGWTLRPEWLAELGVSPKGFAYAPPHVGEAPPEELLAAARDGVLFMAHNAWGFDEPVWDAQGLPRARWVDSLPLARRAGLPGPLDALGLALYGRGKDRLGAQVLRLLCSPQRDGNFLPPDGPRLSAVIRYCLKDVLLMACAVQDEDLDAPHADDEALAAHYAIHQRGVAVDAPLARLLLDVDARAIARAIAESPVPAEILRSQPQLLRWLRERGIALPNVTAATLRSVKSDDPEARAVIHARSAVARVTKGKAAALLARASRDGRLRGALAYWVAHTGRWGGRGFQPQNLTRPVRGVDYGAVHGRLQELLSDPGAAVDYLWGVATSAQCDMGALLSSLLRGLLVPGAGYTLACWDYSAIEARVLLWLAGDEESLAVYRRHDAHGGPDPYMHMGAKIFDRGCAEDVTRDERQVAKVAVLACGYGGSVQALEAMAATYGTSVPEPRRIVDAWRDANPSIAGTRRGGFLDPHGEWIIARGGGVWKDLDATVRAAIGGAPGVAARCNWHMRGPHLVCMLPSGRPAIYREARVEEWDTLFGRRPSITYSHQGRRRQTYGGTLTENVASAIARDLMADALAHLRDARVVLTVHDEIVAEVATPDESHAIRDAMLRTPSWAAGIPVAVAGGVMPRYGK
jgi:DNA polymerase